MKKLIKLILLKLILTLGIILFTTATHALAKPYYYDDYQKFDKVIRINTYANMLSYYEKWTKIWEMPISSWDAENFTPRWRFKIQNKHEFMYSKSAGKWMPYWMEFYEWTYWIHSLPENINWKLDTTSTIWETAAWWCVRLDKTNAKQLYEWADFNTMVLIDYDKKEYANSENDETTIRNYYNLINEEKFEDAYNMRLNKWFTLDTFQKINKWYKFNITEIKQVTGWEYLIKIEVKKWETIIKRQKAKFFISNWKIIRSYLIK